MSAAADQQQLPGMPARLLTVTPTRLTTFVDCPRRYRMTYLDRPSPPKGPPRAHTGMGAAVHVALAAWWAEPLPRRTPQRAAELVRGAWRGQGFRDDEQSSRWRQRCEDAVTAYAERLDPSAEPVGVERTVGTRTATLAVSGRVDRLDRRGEELVVVDYKLGRRTPDEADARSSLALALYALAAGRTLRRPCRRVELHHVPSGTVAAAAHDAGSIQRKVAEAESIGADLSAALARHEAGDADAFPARPSRSCSWCDLRPACEVGREAAPDVDPWAGLGE